MVTALSDPTAVGISNVNEREEFSNVITTSGSVPDLLWNKYIAENIQNAQVSVDRHVCLMRLQQIPITITEKTVMMSSTM